MQTPERGAVALAPQAHMGFGSPPSAIADTLTAVGEPALIASWWLVVASFIDPPLHSADLVLFLLLLALTFPAPARTGVSGSRIVSELILQWVALLLVLVVCGWATQSLSLFKPHKLMLWAATAPLVQGFGIQAFRLLQRRWQHRRASGVKAIVIGAGPTGVRMARLLRKPSFDAPPKIFLGWFDRRWKAPSDRRSRRLGGLDQLPGFLKMQAVDEAYIVLDDAAAGLPWTEWLKALKDSTASVYLVPDVWNTLVVQGHYRTLDGLPVLSIMESPFTGLSGLIKRLSDLILASLILLLIWPLMLVIALAVKLESPGPAIFRQRRLGLAGREIEVWKFRSMRVQEDGPEIRQATLGDTRITRLGRFLRRSSLDELPQFFNVLQGRMSIVGPRPHALSHNHHYRDLIEAYMVRHKVRPGITGWAQVHGFRGETDTLEKMHSRVMCDLYYLQNWSMALDLQIMLKTVTLVFKDPHAF